jgi:hypothetical protein
MEIILGILGALLLIVIAFFYGAFAWGFVCYKFWYWFLLPVFTTLPEVNLVQCVGLMLFIGLFQHATPQIIKKEYKDETTQNILAVVAPPVVLLVGWIVKVVIVH